MFRGSRGEGLSLDYQKLASFLTSKAVEQYDLLRVLLYCTVDPSQDPHLVQRQKALYQKFDGFRNFDVKEFELKISRDPNGKIIKQEKGVDVALVTDLLLLATRNAYDVAIVCAGDADMVSAIEGVKEMGKQVYVAAFDRSCSLALKRSSLGYISLTENATKF